MAANWQLRISENRQEVFVADLTGPAVLGRQDKGQNEEGPYWKKQEQGIWRVVIAPVEEHAFSRKQLQVEPGDNGTVKLTNLGKRNCLVNGNALGPDASCEVTMPAFLTLGARAIRIQESRPEGQHLQSLIQATRLPGASVLSSIAVPLGKGMEPETLVDWIQAVLMVLQSAAGSLDFFARAGRAVVDLVGLDSGRVLLLENGRWKEQACQITAGLTADPDWQPSYQVMQKVLEEKKTFWQIPEAAGQSLAGVKAVVAAPILDRRGQVIGSLYGERRLHNQTTPITKLEAMLVEVLAGGVAAGLARVEEEKAALRLRVQFEQFFSPNLARKLVDNPDLLKGQDALVSILFCDIRGFSRISERLGPAGTVPWIAGVMEVLSDCIWEQDGVVLEYVGDEVRGMWGAPDLQPDHAARACRAGLAMMKRLPELSEKWLPVLGERMDLGIGIHTGPAWVGNVGSQKKFKYGPQGNAMSLASRVQGATKYLKNHVLITGDTQACLDPTFATRHLCRVRVVNIAQPVDLYELVEPGKIGWSHLQTEYEEAWKCFEKKAFSQAAHLLTKLLVYHPGDGPSLVLLSRIVQCLVEEPANFDVVWDLPGK
jgi:adenylate cyclase